MRESTVVPKKNVGLGGYAYQDNFYLRGLVNAARVTDVAHSEEHSEMAFPTQPCLPAARYKCYH